MAIHKQNTKVSASQCSRAQKVLQYDRPKPNLRSGLQSSLSGLAILGLFWLNTACVENHYGQLADIPEREGPTINIISPSRAAIVVEEFITVNGTVQDDSGIDGFWINGQAVAIDPHSGRFAYTVPNQNLTVFEMRARDIYGNTNKEIRATVQDRFLPSTDAIGFAYTARLLDESLLLFAGPIEQILRSLDIEGILLGIQQDNGGQIVGTCEGGNVNCSAAASLEITDIDYDPNSWQLAMRLEEEGLHVEASLSDIRLEALGRAAVWGADVLGIGISIGLDQIHAQATYHISKEENGDLLFQVQNDSTLQLHGLTYEPLINGEPLTAVEASFGVFENIIESVLRDLVLENVVENNLRAKLDEWSLSAAADILETSIVFDGAIEKALFNETEGLVSMTSIVTPASFTEDGIKVARPGNWSYYSANLFVAPPFVDLGQDAFPGQEAFFNSRPTNPLQDYAASQKSTTDEESSDQEDVPYTPFLNSTASLQAAVDINMLNQLLSTLWQGRVLDTTIPLHGVARDQSGLASLSLGFGLPGVITVEPEAGFMRLTVGELQVAAEAFPIGGEIVRVNGAASTLINLKAGPQGGILLVPEGDINITVETVTADSEVIAADQATAIVNVTKNIIQDELAKLLETLELPLLEGLEVQQATPRLYGWHAVIEGEMVYTPPEIRNDFFPTTPINPFDQDDEEGNP